MAQPIISWYETSNDEENEVTDIIQYGTVDADTDSGQKTFYIWNNRNGEEDVPKMEEVTFTTRDRLGGTGDTTGNTVEAVRDNWFQVRVDSLDEVSFTPVGKGGEANESGVKEIGTNGSTVNPNAENASEWSESSAYEKGDYISPLSPNDFFYKVTVAGTTGGTEPEWSLTEGNVIEDGTVEYTAIKIEKAPEEQELLGVQNSVSENGSDADQAGGNFAKVTVFAEVPITASAGKNLLVQRVSYRYV